MATWEEYKANADKMVQEDITLYRNAVKYAKHSKKKAKAEKNLAEALRHFQYSQDVQTMPLEMLQKKYPDLLGSPEEE